MRSLFLPGVRGCLILSLFLAFSLFLSTPVFSRENQQQEPLRLEEKVIWGEDRHGPEAAFFFPAQSSFPDTELLERYGLFLHTLSWSTLSFEAGTQKSFGLSFFRNWGNRSLGLKLQQEETDPFPEVTREFTIEFGFQKMTKLGIFHLFLAGGIADNLPASRDASGKSIPASLSESGIGRVGFSSLFFPNRPLNPVFSLYRQFTKEKEAERTVVLPQWVGEVALLWHLEALKTTLKFFVTYQFDYANSAVQEHHLWLPGLAVSYHFRKDDALTLKIKNFSERKFEILPGFSGPGSVATLQYTHSF